MDNKPKRKRIITTTVESGFPVNREIRVEDNLEFIPNNATPNARNIENRNVSFSITVFGDKHYIIRYSAPDEEGAVRVGIDIKATVRLVFKSVKHIIYYIFRNTGFNPMNFPVNVVRNKRLVLIDELQGEDPLNVVVEIHFENIDTYEFTIMTAMKVSDFRMSDGQHAIKFNGNNSSLVQLKRGVITEIDTCNN